MQRDSEQIIHFYFWFIILCFGMFIMKRERKFSPKVDVDLESPIFIFLGGKNPIQKVQFAPNLSWLPSNCRVLLFLLGSPFLSSVRSQTEKKNDGERGSVLGVIIVRPSCHPTSSSKPKATHRDTSLSLRTDFLGQRPPNKIRK